MARRSRGSSRRSPRVKTFWELIDSHADDLGISSQAVVDLTADPILSSGEDSGRILRLVGHITASNGSVTGEYHIGIGLSLVIQDAVGVVTPDPLTDDMGWYYHMTDRFHLSFGGGSRNLAEFDIRTSRRLRAGFRLLMVKQNGATSAGTLDLSFHARALWAVP